MRESKAAATIPAFRQARPLQRCYTRRRDPDRRHLNDGDWGDCAGCSSPGGAICEAERPRRRNDTESPTVARSSAGRGIWHRPAERDQVGNFSRYLRHPGMG